MDGDSTSTRSESSFPIKMLMLINCRECIYLSLHGEKFISKLYFFYKKIHYCYSDAGGHTQNVGFLLF